MSSTWNGMANHKKIKIGTREEMDVLVKMLSEGWELITKMEVEGVLWAVLKAPMLTIQGGTINVPAYSIPQPRQMVFQDLQYEVTTSPDAIPCAGETAGSDPMVEGEI